jgi:hypothetical protein
MLPVQPDHEKMMDEMAAAYMKGIAGIVCRHADVI